MPRILFSDGKNYDLQLSNFHLEDAALRYVETGDRHGNNNIRSDYEKLTAAQVIAYIKPEITQKALAAKVDDKLVPLTAKITQDCSLKPITYADGKEGAMVYYHSLAFMLAACIYEIRPAYDLMDVQFYEDHCELHYKCSKENNLLAGNIAQWMKQVESQDLTIAYRDIWPKEMLEDSFDALQQSYNKARLSSYDEYENVPVVIYGQYAMAVDPTEVFVTRTAVLHLSQVDVVDEPGKCVIKGY